MKGPLHDDRRLVGFTVITGVQTANDKSEARIQTDYPRIAFSHVRDDYREAVLSRVLDLPFFLLSAETLTLKLGQDSRAGDEQTSVSDAVIVVNVVLKCGTADLRSIDEHPI